MFGRVFDLSLAVWSSVRLLLKCFVVCSTLVWLLGASATLLSKCLGRLFDLTLAISHHYFLRVVVCSTLVWLLVVVRIVIFILVCALFNLCLGPCSLVRLLVFNCVLFLPGPTVMFGHAGIFPTAFLRSLYSFICYLP